MSQVQCAGTTEFDSVLKSGYRRNRTLEYGYLERAIRDPRTNSPKIGIVPYAPDFS